MNHKLIMITLSLVLAACSRGDDTAELEKAAEQFAEEARAKVERSLQDPPGSIGEAIERVGEAITDGDQSVAASDLKALLPDELAGMKRVSYEAERTGIGIKVSKARAEYGEQSKRLSLMITDLGAVSSLARMGMELFENEVDREDESGFERTTTYKGHRSYERMIRQGDQSLTEIMVFVDGRFTLQLDGQNVGWDEMTEARDEVDIESLQTLAKQVATN